MPRYSRVIQDQKEDRVLKPEWLRVKFPTGSTYANVKENIRDRGLHTVCEEANCPNIAECWGGGTATIMLMGDTCTRGCKFCMVKSGNPHGMLDALEPLQVAKAVSALGLTYVVLTSVDRDDLVDGGASHFAATISAIKQHDSKVIIEALIPDFQGNTSHLAKVVDAAPDVIAHNIETTETLTPKVRDSRATYAQSLGILKSIKELNPNIHSKSSIMLGLGESADDLLRTMKHLREAGVDILTLGQYLRPTKNHIPVHEYVNPATFQHYKQSAQELGFLYVASGPFVRSSYRAGEFFVEAMIREKRMRLISESSGNS